MFTKKLQRKFVAERFDQMQKQIRKFRKKQDLEAIHQFRVNVKKLKAYLKLLQFTNQDIKASFIKKELYPIYKHAGRIRTADLNCQLINAFFEDSRVLKKEQKRIKKQSKSFIKQSRKYLKKLNKIKQKMTGIIRNIDTGNIHSFYQSQVDKIDAYFHADDVKQYLHDNRKEIKTLYYIDQILSKTNLPVPLINREYLHALEENIGQWHDVQDTILFLESNQHQGPLADLHEKADRIYANVVMITTNFASTVYSTDVSVHRSEVSPITL